MIKKLLQTQPNEHKDIIAHMAKLMDFITVPQARASILWLLGEYSDRVPKIAPDVLRKMAKSFINEQDIVKLQTLNLAVKLYLSNPNQTKLLCQYVFQLAKYDQNYDIRDRARFLRHFIFNQDGAGAETKLSQFAKKIFLAPKPAPMLESRFKDSQFQLGTLSHYLDTPCVGHHILPPFPDVAPDPSVRDVAEPVSAHEIKDERQSRKEKREKKAIKEKEKRFYSEDESSPAEGNAEFCEFCELKNNARKFQSLKATRTMRTMGRILRLVHRTRRAILRITVPIRGNYPTLKKRERRKT